MMIALYITNMLLNRRLTKFICCYYAICATVMLTLTVVSLYIKYNFLNFIDINSSIILFVIVAILLTVMSLFDLKSNKQKHADTCSGNGQYDAGAIDTFADIELRTANSVVANVGDKFSEKVINSIDNTNNAEKSENSGNVLYDYRYYYDRNNDKYSEPYTSGAKTILRISRRKNGDLGIDVENISDRKLKNASVLHENTNCYKKQNSFVKKINTICNIIKQKFLTIKKFLINSLMKVSNNATKEQRKNNEKQQNVDVNKKATESAIVDKQTICSQATKIMCYKNNSIQDQNNIQFHNEENNLKLEEKILQKTKEIIDNNNASVTNSIDELRTNINILYKGMQGMIDRMTKMFEVMTVAIQRKM